ncbi:MAG: hypothetical protein MHM6MM_009340 [Cercozoa sp. M6MM]
MSEQEGVCEAELVAAAQKGEISRVRELLASGVPGQAVDDGVSALCRCVCPPPRPPSLFPLVP